MSITEMQPSNYSVQRQPATVKELVSFVAQLIQTVSAQEKGEARLSLAQNWVAAIPCTDFAIPCTPHQKSNSVYTLLISLFSVLYTE